MRKKMLGVTLMAVLTSMHAWAMPDELLEAPAHRDTTAVIRSMDMDGVHPIIKAVKPTTKNAIVELAEAWSHANERYAVAKEHAAVGMLTDEDKAWLDSTHRYNYLERFSHHGKGRAEFFARSHNWAAHKEDTAVYNYVMIPGRHYDENGEFMNSYGYDVVYGMVDSIVKEFEKQENVNLLTKEDIMKTVENGLVKAQESVYNDEMRYYLNETIWFAAKQTVKEMKKEEPQPQKEDRKVSLWTAIQER